MKSLTSSILKKLIDISGEEILFPYYHSVTDTLPNYSKHLYLSREIDTFKRDLDVLLKFYTPISIEELINLVRSGERTDKKFFHLTFDDGLSNFYDIVAPILVEKNIPATIFLNTAFIDNKELFYRYKASLLIEKFIHSDSKTYVIFKRFIKEQNTRKSNVISFLLGISYKKRELLNQLAKKVGVDFAKFLEKEKPYLTTLQVQDLITKGFTIGAHSIDHPPYKEIDVSTQIRQTKTSVDWILQNFRLDYKVFSFPFEDTTVSRLFFESINNTVDISFGTSGLNQDVILNNFQRIPIEQKINKLEYYLLLKYLKYIIKLSVRKNTINRVK